MPLETSRTAAANNAEYFLMAFPLWRPNINTLHRANVPAVDPGSPQPRMSRLSFCSGARLDVNYSSGRSIAPGERRHNAKTHFGPTCRFRYFARIGVGVLWLLAALPYPTPKINRAPTPKISCHAQPSPRTKRH